jgi:predicted nucleotidyltransferase
MADRADLSAKLPQIADICRRYGVQQLLLFGSGLGPDYRADSDLDFLVEFYPNARIGLIQFGLLQQELESLLQRKVDLVSKRGLKPLIRESALQRTEPVYAG